MQLWKLKKQLGVTCHHAPLQDTSGFGGDLHPVIFLFKTCIGDIVQRAQNRKKIYVCICMYVFLFGSSQKVIYNE